MRNNPLNRIDPTGHRDECGISTEGCGCPNCSPILGYAAKRKKPTGKIIGFEYAVPFKKTIFGKALSRIPIVSKLVDKTPFGSVIGLELVRLNKGGDMKPFFIVGTGPTPNRSSWGDGTHYSVYVGNVYNLEDVNNYGSPFTMPQDTLTSFSGLRELHDNGFQRYGRTDATAAYGLYGLTVKHAVGKGNQVTTTSIGWAGGAEASFAHRTVRAIPVEDTLEPFIEPVSEFLGNAVWHFNWQGGSLIDMFDTMRNAR